MRTPITVRRRVVPHAIVAALAIGVATPATPQIPTTDFANIAARAVEWAGTIAQLVETYRETVNILRQAEAHYDSIRGATSFDDLLDTDLARQFLPVDLMASYDRIRAEGSAGLSADGRQVYDDYALNAGFCDAMPNDIEVKICQATSVKAAEDKAFATAAAENLNAVNEAIGELRRRLTTSAAEDPKAKQELEVLLGVQQAALQAESLRLDLQRMASDAEEQLIAQRRFEQMSKQWESPTGIEFSPVTFGRAAAPEAVD